MMFRRRVFTWAAENIVSYFDCCVIRLHSTSPIAIWLGGGVFRVFVSICGCPFAWGVFVLLGKLEKKKRRLISPPFVLRDSPSCNTKTGVRCREFTCASLEICVSQEAPHTASRAYVLIPTKCCCVVLCSPDTGRSFLSF